MPNPLVSTITVNYNHKYFPKLCLEAVLESDLPLGSIQPVFVDNASTEFESVNYLREQSKKGIINFIESKENLGFAGGNNLGAKVATGEFILILNPDTTVSKPAIRQLVEFLRQHPDVGIVGPKLQYSDGTIQESCRRDMSFVDLVIKRTFLKNFAYFREREARYLMKDFKHDRTAEVELITGACMMLRRSVYEQVGGFDDRYFLFMEDFDLCKKVRNLGLKVVYFPEAVVGHFHKRLSDGGFLSLLRKKVFWLHLSSAIKYFWKWR